MGKKLVDINANDYVYVRLTDAGKDYLKNVDRRSRLQDLEEDTMGWSKWQLWDLIQTFGPSLNQSATLPFWMDMRMEAKDVYPLKEKIFELFQTWKMETPRYPSMVRRVKEELAKTPAREVAQILDEITRENFDGNLSDIYTFGWWLNQELGYQV